MFRKMVNPESEKSTGGEARWTLHVIFRKTANVIVSANLCAGEGVGAMTADFEKDFAFSVNPRAHDIVRRACYRLIPHCCGVSRATPADDRRGVDYWLTLPTGRRGLDLKLRRQDFGARRGGPLDCVIELESHGTSGWLLKPSAAEWILFAAITHRVALFETVKLRTAVILNLSRWLESGLAVPLTTHSQRGDAHLSSSAVAVSADLLEAAIDALETQGAANDDGGGYGG